MGRLLGTRRALLGASALYLNSSFLTRAAIYASAIPVATASTLSTRPPTKKNYTLAGVISGAGALTASANVTLTGTNTNTGLLTVMPNYTVQLGTVTSTTLQWSGPMALSMGAVLSMATNSSQLSVPGVISGAGGAITLNGSGAVGNSSFMFSSVCTSTASIELNRCRIQLESLRYMPATGVCTVRSGSSIFVNGGTVTVANSFRIAGNGWPEAAGILGAIRYQGTVTFTGVLTLDASATITNYSGTADTGIFSGVVSGASGYTLTLNTNAQGVVVFTGNSAATMLSPITHTQGTLAVSGQLGSVVTVPTIGIVSGNSATTGSLAGVTFAAATGVYQVNAITTTSASKLAMGVLSAPSGFKINVVGALAPGVYPIATSTSGTPTPTLGTNTSGRTVSFAWAANTLNMTLV